MSKPPPIPTRPRAATRLPAIAQRALEEDAIQASIFEFNQNPKSGIQRICIAKHLEPTAKNISRLLLTTKGLKSTKVGEFLAKPENNEIAHIYFSSLNLDGPISESLRISLTYTFRLPGEAEDIDRIMQIFADVYSHQNPNCKFSSETVYVISYALIMLNVDLHNENSKHPMTLPQFISNIRGVVSEELLSDEELQVMYDDIKSNPIIFGKTPNDVIADYSPKINGVMWKKSDRVLSKPTKHYFVLSHSSLLYFDTEFKSESPLGSINLIGVRISQGIEDREFYIESLGHQLEYVKFTKGGAIAVEGVKRISFLALTSNDAQMWIYRLKSSIVDRVSSRPLSRDNSQPLFRRHTTSSKHFKLNISCV